MNTDTAGELLSEMPVITGLSFRRFLGPQDFPAMTAIINAANAEDGVEEVEGVDEVANEYSHLANCDPTTDMMFVEVEGALVGFTRVWWRVDEAGNRLYWHLAYLDPAWRRRGLGRAMLRWSERRLLQIAAGQHLDGETFFQVWTQDSARGKNALLEQEGYRPERYFHFMQRKGLDHLPEAPLPAGVELRPVQPEHLPLIWAAKEEAFADHWGHTVKSEADYQSWANYPAHDLDLWIVAWDGDQVTGTALSYIHPEDNARFGFQRGEIRDVAVRWHWRGRGLGRALIVASLRALQRRGMTEAVLGVDSESLTGALRLYESTGFRTIAQDMVMRKPVP